MCAADVLLSPCTVQHVCACTCGSEGPAGTLHGGMHMCVHACAMLCTEGCTCVCTQAAAGTTLVRVCRCSDTAPCQGLGRAHTSRVGLGPGWVKRWGPAGVQGWGAQPRGGKGRRGGGGPCFSPNASDTNHFRVFPRDAQTSQKFTDPNPTCKQKRAGAGPPAAPSPPAGQAATPGPPHVAATGRCRHGPAGRLGMGRAPRCQGSPPRAGVPGGAAWGQRLVLSWETGPQLYQMPLDRPPGGARIRAEARFGTWSSI